MLNIEIKARCEDPEKIKKALDGAEFVGTDHQIDTYFNVPNGRLKLRQGKIESALIAYQRDNQPKPKASQYSIYQLIPWKAAELKAVLTQSLGVKVVVDKRREIYRQNNIKFHIDEVKGLGSFVEIEAIETENVRGQERLLRQCQLYMDIFGINKEDLLAFSYSDMLLEQQTEK